MKIEIRFRDTDARTTEYYLRRYFKSKAKLEKLAKRAIREVAAMAARDELKELGRKK